MAGFGSMMLLASKLSKETPVSGINEFEIADKLVRQYRLGLVMKGGC